MRILGTLFFLLLLCLPSQGLSQPSAVTTIADSPAIALSGVGFTVTHPAKATSPDLSAPYACLVYDVDTPLLKQSVPSTISEGRLSCAPTLASTGSYRISLVGRDTRTLGGHLVIAESTIRVIHGAWSLLPALIAIGMALLTRQVIPALFLGTFAGAWIVQDITFSGALAGLLAVADTYLLQALVPPDGNSEHLAIVLFSLMTGGMIGVISHSGGMGGIVRWLTRLVRTRRGGQTATSLLGCTIFFDDYANTLIVGNTMRPLADKLRISREKLAYLVDSTAAPIACIAIVTTWIGFEVSLVADTLPGMDGLNISAFELVLRSIPYSFYPILTLIFIACLIATGRDFGPMAHAEAMALRRISPTAEPDKQPHADALDEPMLTDDVPDGPAYLAFIPIIMLIGVTLLGLMATGSGENLREILGSADPFTAMLWASMMSLITAILLAVATRAMSLSDAFNAMEKGLAPMLLAVIILTFAWAIANVNSDLHTADYIVSLLGDSITPALLPAIIFVVACLTSFATGASWGTMGILVPLVLPLTWTAMQHSGMDGTQHLPILYAAIASVLAGAVWGDHCSPISDTTILSSLASGCDHMAHVQTQLPYALLVGITALLMGVIPAGFGVPWWLGLGVASLALFLILRSFGKETIL